MKNIITKEVIIISIQNSVMIEEVSSTMTVTSYMYIFLTAFF